MIVVDTNIIAYFYLTGELSEVAEQVLHTDPDWNAPHLWRSEFRNVLALYLRRGKLSLAEAIRIMHQAELHMQGKDYPSASEQVLQLAASSGCSAYDCEFVALAQLLDIILVTWDRQLLKSFPGIALHPDKFCNLR